MEIWVTSTPENLEWTSIIPAASPRIGVSQPTTLDRFWPSVGDFGDFEREVSPDLQRLDIVSRVDLKEPRFESTGEMVFLCFLIVDSKCSMEFILLDASTLLSSSE